MKIDTTLERMNIVDELGEHHNTLIKSDKAELCHDIVFTEHHRRILDSIVFSVNPIEIAKMYNVLAGELNRRKLLRMEYNKPIKELQDTHLSLELDTIHIHVLLPSKVKNKNIDLLKKLCTIGPLLEVKFIFYVDSEVDSYWDFPVEKTILDIDGEHRIIIEE